ncbi:Protein of uncharacterised function (DUF1205) [Raoultella terrigena]|uniref:Protein of uncharacterized function (DUF1205) n=1 Tax=Raoultella terrigena TaxID=577 RepID=A0A3P8KGC0_RAOTE|nr:Protein of uncharacterised function (DUF1205) [Raoultella terrigena]
MQYVPYNGGAVWEKWWDRTPDRKRLLVSLGTVKPMVDGLDLIAWVMDSAGEVDADIILHLSANARSDLRTLPPNVRLVDWIPMGSFSTRRWLHSPRRGGKHSDGPARRDTADRVWPGSRSSRSTPARLWNAGAGSSPVMAGLTSGMINDFLGNRALRTASGEVAAEMAAQATPSEVANNLVAWLQRG